MSSDASGPPHGPAPDESARGPAIAPASSERAAIGPGLIFALSVVGAGDYVSNVSLGATYGTALLWTLVIASTCRYVWVETCARFVLATGQTPFQGFARLSRKLLWLILFALVVHRHVHGLGHVIFMGTTAQMLIPLPKAGAVIWSLVSVALGFWMIFWSGYKTLERAFKVLMAIMGGALVVVVILSPPPFWSVVKGLFIPSIPDKQGVYSLILLLTALLGTEACSLSNVTYSYFMWQKGWRDMSYSKRQRKDLLYGIGAMFMMGCFLQIAAAGVIGPGEKAPSNVNDLVRVFTAHLGETGRVTFAIGIWAAVFTSYVGGISGYSLAITDVITTLAGSASKMNRSREELRRDPRFRALVIFFCFSPLYILYTSVRPVGLVLAAAASAVLLVPIVSLALLRLTSDASIMGKHRNPWIKNAVLLFISLVACYLIYKNGGELLARVRTP